jgi:uncharacterized protein (DUF1501 family)
MSTSRRAFLRAAASMAAAAGGTAAPRFSAPLALGLAGIGTLASHQAQAAGISGDYRALVCLYLAGGNDSHNWLIPADNSSYAEYARSRSNLALAQASLSRLSATPSQSSGRQFGLSAELQALKDLYEQRSLAFVANVGTLTRPTTLADFRAGNNLPAKLFSHNDQASTWQSFSPEGAHAGWGGRIGDILMSANTNPVFTSVSAAGSAVFLTGTSVVQYQLGLDGPVGINGLKNGDSAVPGTVAYALKKVLAANGDNSFQAEYTRVVQRSADSYTVLSNAMARNTVLAIPTTATSADGRSGALNQDPLAKQLRVVAQMIAANQTLGMKRQVFMVSIGGFDTHANQLADHATLSKRVALSTAYFQSAMQALGLFNNVTLFTASDFGRGLVSNGSGSDHGWGSHHFVAGGAVKGKDIYGRFPTLALGSNDDTGSGRMLPGTSVAEYAAPLARWMGLSETDIAAVLPSLSAFGSNNLAYI